MTSKKTWMIGLGLVLPLAGCPGDDSGTTAGNDSGTGTPATDSGTETPDPTDGPATTTEGEDTTGDDPTGDPPAECMGIGGAGADGDACTANGDCASGVCTIFTDVPLNADAVCAPTPADCGTRVTGTVFDFVTGETVAGADLVVAAALQAATNPTGAMALVEATSDADGRVDAASAGAISAPLGIVGLTAGAGYYLTATGLAAPNRDGSSYDVGTGTHDIWVVPEGELSDWSDALGMDGDVDPKDLPLGDAGGVVGFVRDGAGAPIAGAVVTSTSDRSGAIVRYLNDDGSFGIDSTSDLGIFVILNPGLPESFEAADAGGAVLGGGTAGSATGAIFTLIING